MSGVLLQFLPLPEQTWQETLLGSRRSGDWDSPEGSCFAAPTSVLTVCTTLKSCLQSALQWLRIFRPVLLTGIRRDSSVEIPESCPTIRIRHS